MIELHQVSKRYAAKRGAITVLDGINLTVQPGARVGVLGRNGAGKSTLVRLISGAENPTSGIIRRAMTVSWPLAFGGAFQGALTGLDNLRFICRLYAVDPEKKIDFVEDFAELGRFLREPVRTYSAGMRARLAFAISMMIEFDCFLIDEIIAVGDSRFNQKCNLELFEKRRDRAMIIVSHQTDYITNHCNCAAVLEEGRLVVYEDVQEAVRVYQRQLL